MTRWPQQWVGLWVADDGKAVLIEIRRRSILVSVAPSVGVRTYESAELLDGSRKRISRLDAIPLLDEEGRRFLQVEAGTPDVGPTYRLYPAVEPVRGHFDRADDSIDVVDVVLLPTTVIGLYDDWDDDMGVPWAYPLQPLRWVASS